MLDLTDLHMRTQNMNNETLLPEIDDSEHLWGSDSQPSINNTRTSSSHSKVKYGLYCILIITGSLFILSSFVSVKDSGNILAIQSGSNAHFTSRFSTFFEANPTRYISQKEEFLKKYNSNDNYGYNGEIYRLSGIELVDRLKGQSYLDWTGSGLYTKSQIEAVSNMLVNTAFGNTHSTSKPSTNTQTTIDDMRDLILSRFHTTSDEYTVVFTSSTTAALRLVADTFPWSSESIFAFSRVNHNSVIGMRQVSKQAGSTYYAVPEDILDSPCTAEDRFSFLKGYQCDDDLFSSGFDSDETVYSLFAYPSQENFAGRLLNLDWISDFHESRIGKNVTGTMKNHKWLVLLDAAAYLPSHDFDLNKYKPDFVTMSFYKMMGYPTGVGALIVHNSAISLLQKKYYGGGTVTLNTVDSDYLVMRSCSDARFEDGTLPFLSIAALKEGFSEIDRIGMDAINKHISVLRDYTVNELKKMKHKNGNDAVRIVGNVQQMGSIVSFLLYSDDGKPIGYSSFVNRCRKHNIHVRGGCMCNPGACQDYLGFTTEEVENIPIEKDSMTCVEVKDVVNGKHFGAVRLSFGYMTAFEDIQPVLDLIMDEYLN